MNSEGLRTFRNIVLNLFLMSLLFSSLPSFADTPIAASTPPKLVKVADLPGGDIVDIGFVFKRPNVVYLASESNAMGIWRSDDEGDTWRQVFADLDNFGPAHISDIAVHPDNPDVVLVADAHALWKMTMVDGRLQRKIVYGRLQETEGKLTYQPLRVYAVAFSPTLSSVSYAADVNGIILRSNDVGDTWQPVGQVEPKHILSLIVDSRSPDILYFGTLDGMFRSADGGRSWQLVLQVPIFSIALVTSDIVFAAGEKGIFKSADRGATWHRTYDGNVNSLQVASSDSRIVYAGTPKGVLMSSDEGETWANRSKGLEHLNVGSLAVHPNDPNTVVAGSLFPLPVFAQGEAIYRTTDGGLSWEKKGREFVDVDVIEVAVDPNNPSVVYVGTRCSRGLYRSEDGGTSWKVISYVHIPNKAAHYTMRIVVSSNSSVWLTGKDGMGWSTDGGLTWRPEYKKGEGQPQYSELVKQLRHFHGLAVSPHDSRIIFVGTVADQGAMPKYQGARIFRSTDDGLSWQEAGTGFPSGADTAIDDIAFDPLDPKVIYVTTASHHRYAGPTSTFGIYKSLDGGETWMPSNTGLTSMDVHSIATSPAKRGLLFAGTHNGVFRSTDGGNTWVPIGLQEHIHRLLVDPMESRSIFVGTNNGLYWSRDGGDTWQRLDYVPAKPVTGLAMDAGGKALYAAVNGVGVFKGVLRDSTPPTISNIVLDPTEPTVEDAVQVAVSVTDDVSGVERVVLVYTRSIRGQEHEVREDMKSVSGTSYSGIILQQPSGTIVRFRVEATDSFGNKAATLTQFYTVKRPTYFTQLERQLSNLKKELGDLQEKHKIILASNKDLQDEVARLKLELTQTQTEKDLTKQQLDTSREDLSRLNAELQSIRASLESSQRNVVQWQVIATIAAVVAIGVGLMIVRHRRVG